MGRKAMAKSYLKAGLVKDSLGISRTIFSRNLIRKNKELASGRLMIKNGI